MTGRDYPDRIVLQVYAPHFVAGAVCRDGKNVSHAAPIIHYMVGWNKEAVQRYCNRKGWTVNVGS